MTYERDDRRTPESSDTERFLSLWGQSRFTLHAMTGRKGEPPTTRQFTDAKGAAAWASEVNAKGMRVYFTVNETKEIFSGKGFAEDVTGVMCVPADFDADTDIRPVTDEEQTVVREASEKYRSYAESLGFGRPMLIASGNGYYPLIRFSEKVPPAKVGDLMRRWEDHYQEKLRTPGVKMDSVCNLDRILGLPGTIKNKLEGIAQYTEDRPNRTVAVVDWGTVTDWTRFEQFASKLPPAESVKAEDVELREIPLPSDMKIPEDVGYILAWDDAARDEFDGDESSAEMSVAARLARDGYDAATIYTLLRAGSIRSMDDPKRDRIDYYRLTIGKALSGARETRAVQAAMRMEREQAVKEVRQMLHLAAPEGTQQKKVPYKAVSNALKVAKDAGLGIGKRDTRTIHDLAALDALNRKEAERAISLLRRYKEPLAANGVNIEDVAVSGEDEGLKPREIANALLNTYHFVTLTDNQELLIYDPTRGVYTENAELVIAGEVRRLMDEAMDDESLTNMVAETQKWVLFDNKNFHAREEFDCDKDRIVVANGILNWRTRTCEDFSPKFLARIRLPVSFDKDAKCPRIDKFVREVVAEADVQTMYEVAGYPLSPGMPVQTAIVLIGEGANGKSTWLEVLRTLYGMGNTTAVSVQHLNENTFAPAQLYGRLANIVGDLPSKKMATTGKFKEAIGGDPMYAEHKNKQPFTFINRAKFIFSCNQLPGSNDDTNAYWRRWILIKFPNTFDNTKARKREELVGEMTTDEELSGLLNRSLEALGQLLDRGHFDNDSLTFEQKRVQGMRMSDSIYAFMQDLVERDDAGEIPKKDFYARYADHCNKVLKVRPKEVNAFYRDLRANLGTDYHDERAREGDKRTIVILGFRWRNGAWNGPNGSKNNPDQNPDLKFRNPDQNGGGSGGSAPIVPNSTSQSGLQEGGQGSKNCQTESLTSSDTMRETDVTDTNGQGYSTVLATMQTSIPANENDNAAREVMGTLTKRFVAGSAHFDIEALGLDPDDPANRVRLIVARYGGESKRFGPLSLPVSDELEGKLLQEFDDWLGTLGFNGEVEHPALKILGWNSHGYDVPLLKARYAAHGMPWGGSNFALCLSIDAMQAHKWLAKKHEASFRLDDVAQHRLGKGKTHGGWRPDLTNEELADYCENDARLVEELDLLFNYSLLVDNVVALTECDPFKWLLPWNGTPENPYRETVPIFALCQKEGIQMEWPNKAEKARRDRLDSGKKNTGGFRFAEAGTYRNVLGLDVTSMYPNLIVSFNMGRETYTENPAEMDIKAEVGGFVGPDRVKSAIARVVENIMDRERELKRLAKADPANATGYLAEREALKVLRNSVYGIFYPTWSPMYKQEIGANITLLGQAVVNEAKRFLEERFGTHVVFMHTDSVYATMPEGTDEAKVVDDLNAHISGWLTERYKTPSPRIAFESKGVWPMFMLKDMGRYAYVDEKGETHMVGYEKGNFSELKRRLQTRVVDSVVAGAKEIDLNGFEWPDSDAVTFVKVGSTGRNTAQVKAYKALSAAGMAPSPGLPVGFVVLKKRRVYWNQETRKWIDDKGATGDAGFLSAEERRWVFAETLKHVDRFGLELKWGDGQAKLDIPGTPSKKGRE